MTDGGRGLDRDATRARHRILRRVRTALEGRAPVAHPGGFGGGRPRPGPPRGSQRTGAGGAAAGDEFGFA
ncbi:MAG: hypothetical protein R3304_11930, partial [Longimicrobiales bacterium]|nr:hypothetical protein [Longimicrobiales bacterium]